MTKKFYGNVTVNLTKEVYDDVKQHDEVNWSAICRQAMIEYLAILPRIQKPLEETPVREQ